jgi:hypothetical protein
VTKFNKDPIKKEYSYSLSSKEKYSEIYLKNKVRQRIPLMPFFLLGRARCEGKYISVFRYFKLGLCLRTARADDDGIAGPDADFLPKDSRKPFIEYLFVH